MGFEDLANGYSGYDSPFDSLNANYGELQSNHPSNYFNFKAQHLGEIGVIERMVGLVANREDMSFGDISLAETYKDGMLNTRVMGGIYNKTLTDMYLNKDDWLRMQGAMSLGGLIKGKNDAEIESDASLFENKASKAILSPKIKDGAYLEGNTAYNMLGSKQTAENILSSSNVGSYLEGNTIYEKESPFKTSEQKNISMSELTNKHKIVFDSQHSSPFDTKSPFDASSPFDSKVNEKNNSNVSNAGTVNVSSYNESINSGKYIEETTNIKKKEIKIDKVEKIFENFEQSTKKNKEKEKNNTIDNLRATKDSNSVNYKSSILKKEEALEISDNLLKNLEIKSDKKPERLEFKVIKK